MYRKKFAAFVLTAVMAMTALTGCRKTEPVQDGRRAAITIDKENISLGELSTVVSYQQASYYDYQQQMFQQYAGSNMVYQPSDETFDRKLEASASEDGEETGIVKDAVKEETFGDQLLNDCIAALVEYDVVNRHADEYKMSLSDEEKKTIAGVASDYFEKNKDVLTQRGVLEEDVVSYLNRFTLYQKIYHAYLNQIKPTAKKADAKMMKCSTIVFTPKEDTDAARKAVLKEAKDVLAKLLDKEDAATASLENLVANSSTASASEETFSVNHDIYAYRMDKAVLQKIDALKAGEVYPEAVANSDGVVRIFRMVEPDDQTDVDSVYKAIVDQEKSDAYKQQFAEWLKGVQVSYDTDALHEVSVTDKIVFSFVHDTQDQAEEVTTESVEETSVEKKETQTDEKNQVSVDSELSTEPMDSGDGQ